MFNIFGSKPSKEETNEMAQAKKKEEDDETSGLLGE